MHRSIYLPFLLVIAACGEGSGPGGSDGALDSDNDGLSDVDEVEIYGTDPFNPDTDGDTWNDGDEVQAGTDPLDPLSFPYRGGWPIHPESDKDALGDPWTEFTRAQPGVQLPRILNLDQFGDVVDLYDFAASPVPILLERVGYGRGGQETQELLRDGTGPLASPISSRLPEVVASRRLYYIRIVGYQEGGRSPTVDTLNAYALDFPNDDSPIILDDDQSRLHRMFELDNNSRHPPHFGSFVVEVDPRTMTLVTDYRDVAETIEDVVGRVLP